ncbi:MAG TPA: hypothetical protein VK551_02480 [Thermodesulfobacteriota bacterium]|nr:hypothetical protein [Thermodesulfobacteriota bacterium]
MKKFAVILAIVMALFVVPCLAQAQVDIRISIPLPPPIVFSAPPAMVVLPETEVYVVPEYDQDLFFYAGWWWRFWLGRWYRSLYYDSGWEFYYGVPRWYAGVYPHWRENYHNHMWGGQRWDYHSVPYGDVRTNWKTWHDTGHYKQNWGTTGSYRHGAEARRDYRGFPQETSYQRTSVATPQAPAETKGRQAPATIQQAPDLSKNKNAFAGVYRGSDAQIHSNRGLQSRQSMPSEGKGGGSKGNVGHGNVGGPHK